MYADGVLVESPRSILDILCAIDKSVVTFLSFLAKIRLLGLLFLSNPMRQLILGKVNNFENFQKKIPDFIGHFLISWPMWPDLGIYRVKETHKSREKIYLSHTYKKLLVVSLF